MLRTVKYLSWLVVQFIGILLGIGMLFIAFHAVSTPLSEFESAGWRILGMASACGMTFPFVLQASLIQSYMPLSLSMGTTRRGFFAGAQAAKVMLAGGIGVCLLLLQLAAKLMFGVDALFTGTILPGMFAVLLLSASVGEVLGFVSLRFGRVGMIVFFILIMIAWTGIGVVIGYASSGGTLNVILDAMLRFLSNAWTLGGSAVVLAMLLGWLDWLLCRRIPVKG